MMLVLAIVAFLVGLLIGVVGIGGILLIPAIATLAGMETRQAMATALFSFIFTAVVGTWLFARHGSIDWKVALPVCVGSLVFGFLGALANAVAPVVWLNLCLALVIIFAGAYVLVPAKAKLGQGLRPATGRMTLLAIGAAVGFVSGLTGVGGPVLSVPIMVVLGFAPITAVATGQIIQVAAASSGTVGNLMHGFIDFSMASWLTVVQLGGLVLGVRLAHSIRADHLRRMVALVCLGVGGFLLARSLLALFFSGGSA